MTCIWLPTDIRTAHDEIKDTKVALEPLRQLTNVKLHPIRILNVEWPWGPLDLAWELQLRDDMKGGATSVATGLCCRGGDSSH